jgi:hypothetical protein
MRTRILLLTATFLLLAPMVLVPQAAAHACATFANTSPNCECPPNNPGIFHLHVNVHLDGRVVFCYDPGLLP